MSSELDFNLLEDSVYEDIRGFYSDYKDEVANGTVSEINYLMQTLGTTFQSYYITLVKYCGRLGKYYVDDNEFYKELTDVKKAFMDALNFRAHNRIPESLYVICDVVDSYSKVTRIMNEKKDLFDNDRAAQLFKIYTLIQVTRIVFKGNKELIEQITN